MQNAEVFVDGKKILASCSFHAMLDQDVLIKFYVAEDELLCKFKTTAAEKNNLKQRRDNDDSFVWNFLLSVPDNVTTLTVYQPIQFTKSDSVKLYYSIYFTRTSAGIKTYFASFVIYEEAL